MNLYNFLNKHALVLSLLIAIFSFILFQPFFYNSNDEKNYIQNAYYLGTDGLIRDPELCINGDSETFGFFNGEGCVSKYNIGTSVILLPFVKIDWQLSFLVTFIFFLGSVYLFSKLLRHYKLPQIFIFLYILYPPLIYYSTKVMSEVYSNFFVLLLFYILFVSKSKYKEIAAATVSGILVFIRYTNIFLTVILLAGYLLQLYKESKSGKKVTLSSLKIGITALPFALAFFKINDYLYGSIFKSGYRLSGEELYFNLDVALGQAAWYLAIFLLIYPGLIFFPKFSNIKEKWLIALSFLVLFVFYVGFPGFHFKSDILNFIFGTRFFMPVIGLLLLVYFDGLYQFIKENKFNVNALKVFITVVILALVVNKLVMDMMLYDKRQSYSHQSDELYENSQDGDTVEGSQILLNEAFKKGFRYKEPEQWTPLR